MLAADLVQIAVLYTETDDRSDIAPDLFEISFVGGASQTQLTRLEIDISPRKLFFDTAGSGVGGFHPFEVVSLVSQNPNASVTATVHDGEPLLILEFANFFAGDKLIFAIDVDEDLTLHPVVAPGQIAPQVERHIDAIASGAEFNDAILRATFSAPHYHDVTDNRIFRHRFDVTGSGVNLSTKENKTGQDTRIAAALIELQQTPKPIAISGTVYLDSNLNLKQEPGEPGLAGVSLTLWQKVGNQYVSTGHTRQTNANGHYTFGTELNLQPGTYQIRQVQPAGLFSVGAVVGTVQALPSGSLVAGDPNRLTDIAIPLGDTQGINYDFAEAQAASISGYVYSDLNNNGIREPGEPGIGQVPIRIIPVSTIAPQQPVTVTTDANGYYQITGLSPGEYRIVQLEQPAGFFDGLDRAGTVNGIMVGTAVNPGDELKGIKLLGGAVGVEYNFGEIAPASLSGTVRMTDPLGNCFGDSTTNPPIAGVRVLLQDNLGQTVAETTTNAVGLYSFVNLMPGIYSVIEFTPAGLIDGAAHAGTVNGVKRGTAIGGGLIRDINLKPGEQGEGFDFCEHAPASLTGFVYHDQNNNGIREANEAPISGVTIQLLDKQGAIVATTVSAADGSYRFGQLRAGEYTLVELQPAGWLDGLDAAGTIAGTVVGSALNPGDTIRQIALKWGDQAIDYNFGELLPGSVAGIVYADANHNCVFDPGELPLAGAKIELLDAQGQVIATTHTNSQGQYKFENLTPGKYAVRETQPVGYFHGGQVAGSGGGNASVADLITEIHVGSGMHLVDYNFCELPPASLSGFVYHDQNNNGIRDANETPISGVTIQLLDQQGTTVATTVSAADGSYRFDQLRAGEYTLVELQPAGWLDGRDAAGTINGQVVGSAVNPGDMIRQIALNWGNDGLNYNFGELRAGSIAGFVHADANHNCVFDPGELPLAGVKIELLDAQGQVIATTHTNSQGQYKFENLTPGKYAVREAQPEGYFHGGQVAGSGGGNASVADLITEIHVGSGMHLVDYNFCELPPASLSGFVYHDQNNNGIREANEAPISGVTIQLLDQQGTLVATTVSAADGSYRFDQLRAGEYTLVELQPAGWLDGLDAAGTIAGTVVGSAVNPGDTIRQIALNWGNDGLNYNFGELRAGSIAGFVHADANHNCAFDPGELPLAGVKIELLDAQGQVIATTHTNSQGRYKFENLTPGKYAVRETQPEGYFQGGQVAGSGGGNASVADLITEIHVGSGMHLVDYNFCELPPASLSGFVYHDQNNNGIRDANEAPISGVTIQLLDQQGTTVATTVSAADGSYRFDQLRAGEYTLVELQPVGWLDGLDAAGTIAGTVVGSAVNPGDTIRQIALNWGNDGLNYNFGELLAGSIAGFVYADTNHNCVFDPGELPLAGVKVELLDAQGNVVATTHTNSQGSYKFDNLTPGKYAVRETQPEGYFHGGQRAGSGGGNTSVADLISEIHVGSGFHLVDYNFCEHPPATLSGLVHTDLNGNGQLDPGEVVLAGVTVELLDANGHAIATSVTNAEGRYKFENLRAGSYSVRQIQPEGYFTVGEKVGFVEGGLNQLSQGQLIGGQLEGGLAGGPTASTNLLRDIVIRPGERHVEYNFYEMPPSTLSGRVFQDGDPVVTSDGSLPDDLRTIRDGQYRPGNEPIAGVVMELRNGINGDPIDASQALPGYYSAGAIVVVTDEQGRYQFLGLPPGNYAVYQQHPEGFADGIDTPGTTSGIAINPSDNVNPLLIQRLSQDPSNDAIILIPLGPGQHSAENNFSEIKVEVVPPPPSTLPPPPPIPPTMIPPRGFSSPGSFGNATPMPNPSMGGAMPFNAPVGGGGMRGHTWHLSVINAGSPRGDEQAEAGSGVVMQPASFLGPQDWIRAQMQSGQWTLLMDDDPDSPKRKIYRFGMPGGIPVVGDWNGDGFDDIGVFYEGKWYLDLNGNGQWDEEDLWARLGGRDDLPVTGDWDGDGKTDIGTFGPEWSGDPRALAVEPGLPDSSNAHRARPKNVPPKSGDATDDLRLLKRSAKGAPRADVIDHVFRYGTDGDIPVAGDWNGDGIATIGIFRNGKWHLDMNGDGQWSKEDLIVYFGQPGDRPVVGDWNGNGIDQIGVFRDGQWILDIDNDHVHTARDRVFQFGGPGDIPVVGDWNGDGVDNPGLYRALRPAADEDSAEETH